MHFEAIAGHEPAMFVRVAIDDIVELIETDAAIGHEGRALGSSAICHQPFAVSFGFANYLPETCLHLLDFFDEVVIRLRPVKTPSLLFGERNERLEQQLTRFIILYCILYLGIFP